MGQGSTKCALALDNSGFHSPSWFTELPLSLSATRGLVGQVPAEVLAKPTDSRLNLFTYLFSLLNVFIIC